MQSSMLAPGAGVRDITAMCTVQVTTTVIMHHPGWRKAGAHLHGSMTPLMQG